MKLRVGLAQINPTVGDLKGNARLIADSVKNAQAQNADLIVFPEMIVTGYPVEDLALRPSFQAASIRAVQEIAANITGDIVAVVGYLELGPKNAAAVIHGGKIRATYVKRQLPNYGVFDEFRNFVPGDKSLVVRINGVDVAVAICEDIWHSLDSIASRTPGLLVVPNGSPFERNKDDVRLALVQKQAKEILAPIVYVNMIGGQDDLVFDGDSIVVGKDGSVLARTSQFDEQLIVVDIDCTVASSQPDVVISEESTSHSISHSTTNNSLIALPLSDEAEMWDALVIGLRDYVIKNRFKSVVIGLSGGIDSALVAAIAIDALGASRVNGVAMPSKYSSSHSIEDAQALADATGVNFRITPITSIVESYMANMVLTGLAEENLQARVRGVTLMGISNQEGHLVLATGNKSELAVGYSTLYGDAVGGFAPIKDIYKTDVWALARYRNAVALERGDVPPIPISSITKAPSAELRPDQKDSDSLPDYLMLDQVLRAYIDGDNGYQALLAYGFDPDLVRHVISLVDNAEYKRRQYPPGTKVSGRAFGKDRRLPMTSLWSEQ
jgi:NAD+ synthase (glutamine-hydrolysing)